MISTTTCGLLFHFALNLVPRSTGPSVIFSLDWTPAALSDSAVYKYWTGVTAGRRAGMARQVARIGELDGLRTGLDADRATDIMFVLNGHSTFQNLVIEAGWTLPTFKAWLYSTLAQQLLTPGDPDPSATV